MDFEALRQSIVDNIVESQVKIGYENTAICLYYPIDSVKRLLGADCSADELKAALESFGKMNLDTLGEVSAEIERERIKFVIGAAGAEYVYNNEKNRGFIEDFINLIRGNCTIDDILGVFRKYSDNVVCEKLDNGEFEYLIYFGSGKPDNYRYCIEFEMGRAVYHRFTPADYAALEL